MDSGRLANESRSAPAKQQPATVADYEAVRSLAAAGKAREALTLLRASDHEDPCGRFLEGVLAVENSEHETAQRIFLALANELPGRIEPLNNVAVLQASAGRLEASAQTLRRALRESASAVVERNLADLEKAAAGETIDLVLLGWLDGCGAARSIEHVLLAWAAAWSAQDVDGYLSFYARNFRPTGGRTVDDWRATRRARLTHPAFIDVRLSDMVVSESSQGRARARFSQAYRSDSFQDLVQKTMVLELQAGKWKIVAEAIE